MTVVRRDTLAWLGIIMLAACSGPRSTGTAPAASAAPPRRTDAPTAEPVHIETNSSGDKYITVVQRVIDRSSKRTRVAYQLRALSSRADIAGTRSVVTFEQPHITFIDIRGKKLIADSPQAKITQRDKSLVMGRGVHARAEDGSVLSCDTLRYDGRTEKLHGQGHVVLARPNELTLTGNYLDGDVRLDDVRVAEHPL